MYPTPRSQENAFSQTGRENVQAEISSKKTELEAMAVEEQQREAANWKLRNNWIWSRQSSAGLRIAWID